MGKMVYPLPSLYSMISCLRLLKWSRLKITPAGRVSEVFMAEPTPPHKRADLELDYWGLGS